MHAAANTEAHLPNSTRRYQLGLGAATAMVIKNMHAA
jgi:hypothetical protein